MAKAENGLRGDGQEERLDSISLYFRDARRCQALTVEREKVLGRQIVQGRLAEERLLTEGFSEEVDRQRLLGEGAQTQMAEGCLFLVVKIAKRYNRPDWFLDLIQEGNLGLLEAVRTFNPDSGRISTWVTFRIKLAMGDFLNYQRGNAFPLPKAEARHRRRHLEIEYELVERLGRKPTDKELAKRLNMSTDRLDEYRANFTPIFGDSLNLSVFSDGQTETEVGDITPDSEGIDPEKRVTEEGIYEAFLKLSPREQEIVKDCIGPRGDHLISEEIGKKHGVSRQRVGQIYNRALEKLRPMLQDFA